MRSTRLFRDERMVWECPTHGLTEMTLSVFEEGGGRWEECPVSMGFEEVCHMRLDGPFVVPFSERMAT